MDYHGSITTFGLGGRGQSADVTAPNNGEMHAALSTTHPNFTKQTQKVQQILREKLLSETE